MKPNEEKTTPTTPAAPVTPAAETTPTTPDPTADQRGSIPEHLKNVTLKETFLPEEGSELLPGAEVAKTPEELKAEQDAVVAPVTPAVPVTPATPAQPDNTQNAEIVDKTKEEPKLLAGKYKTVDELKKGIEELGGDPTLSDDPAFLEQAYLVVQKQYTKFNQTQERAKEIAEAPKPFELTDDLITEMVDELDFTKIKDARDMARAQFQIMFKTIMKNLPQMLPKQAEVDPVKMAGEIDRVTKGNDALGFIEGKVPRLVTDTNFRNAFARHLQSGKDVGTYPAIVDRKVMTQAMKDFLDGAASTAAEAAKMGETTTQEKAAAAQPDAGGALSTETPADPEEDILGGIVGAKKAHDSRLF